MSATVEFRHVTKRFGDILALQDISLCLENGEFFSVIGPSGCGKTTLLKLIGGLLTPDAGEILIDGKVVNDIPSYRRSSNIVFQNYALFPHLNVFENVAFGLRLQMTGATASELRHKADKALGVVRLEDFGDRMPGQLSGGQQQRVAVARALVLRPKVIMLDEPLAALDRKLRKEMQAELRRIHQEVGITFVYVTHDHEVAMSMSDRLAVMDHGIIEQVGDPDTIYHRPQTRFVAEFMGASNIFEGEIAEQTDGARALRTASGLTIDVDIDPSSGKTMCLSLRPELIDVYTPDLGIPHQNQYQGEIVSRIFLGNAVEYVVRLETDDIILSRVPSRQLRQSAYKPGDRVTAGWNRDCCNELKH